MLLVPAICFLYVFIDHNHYILCDFFLKGCINHYVICFLFVGMY